LHPKFNLEEHHAAIEERHLSRSFDSVKRNSAAIPDQRKAAQSVAYAFTDTGHFVTKAAIDNNGSVTLTVPSVSSARNVRVVVGPELTGEKQPALSDLTRRGAQEQFVRVDPGAVISTVAFDIPRKSGVVGYVFAW